MTTDSSSEHTRPTLLIQIFQDGSLDSLSSVRHAYVHVHSCKSVNHEVKNLQKSLDQTFLIQMKIKHFQESSKSLCRHILQHLHNKC